MIVPLAKSDVPICNFVRLEQEPRFSVEAMGNKLGFADFGITIVPPLPLPWIVHAERMFGVLSCKTVARDTVLCAGLVNVSELVPPPLKIFVESH
jgi:hypothetical protein